MTTTRIGPYELLAPLGEGGMGKVYRARDTRLDRTVAIKFIHGRGVGDPDRRLRFLREARAEAALSHPNIATVLDVGEAEVDDPELMPKGDARASAIVPYLVLEFVAGEELRDRIHGGPIPLAETLRLAHQIVAGLKAAHAAGIVHRDLKPSNIRITADGLVKLLDFGLARFVPLAPRPDDSPTDIRTAEGSVLGTPPYLAPEQAAGQPLDHRADLFALGVILFEMRTGERPFRGDHPIELLQSVLRDEPASLAERDPESPPRLAALVARLLAKNPLDRPATTEEVGRELDAIARSIADLPTSIVPTMPALAARRTLPRRQLLGVALALLVLGAFVFPWLRRQQSRGEAMELHRRGTKALELDDSQAPRIAAELFEQAVTVDPTLAPAWAGMAEAWADVYEHERLPKLLDRAELAARRAIELRPDEIDGQIALATILRTRGEPGRAIAMLERLLSTGQRLDSLHGELARAYEDAGDPRRAEEQYVAAVAAREGWWKSWLNLGEFRFRQGNYPGARTAFEKAAELAPANQTTPAENLASLLLVEGKNSEALAAYEAIPGPVTTADAASNLGTLYHYNGKYEDAERSYRRAIQIRPREPIYHRNLADTLLRLGRQDEATTEYREALRLVGQLLTEMPKDTDLRLQETLYLARVGECPRAVELAANLDAELPDSAWAQHALARPFALCRAEDEAIGYLRRAVALGFSPDLLRDEDELASLRESREFQQLVGKESAPQLRPAS